MRFVALFGVLALLVVPPSSSAADSQDDASRVIKELMLVLREQGIKSPPIVVVSEEQYHELMGGNVLPNTTGFRRSVNGVLDPNIYLVNTSQIYQLATRPGQSLGVKLLASYVVHEDYHGKNGPAEVPAYEAQAKFLQTLAALSGSAEWRWLQVRVNALKRYIDACRAQACKARTIASR